MPPKCSPGKARPDALPELPDLDRELLALLGQIPRGRVATYGTLAQALGSMAAARFVGHFMMHHEHGADCPCHRIVRATGDLGGYVDATPGAKAKRLRSDGVACDGKRVDLATYRFDGFRGDRPLEQLQRIQDDAARRVVVCRREKMPEVIGGVDVSYPTPRLAVAAYALVDWDSGELAWSTTVCRPHPFPYIPGLLSFRELPVLLDLLDAVERADRLAEIFLVDGSGQLHPRRFGSASHFGVAAAIPTIGVTKKRLCGTVDLEDMAPREPRDVFHQGRRRGVAIRPTAGSRRPIFISVGHRENLRHAECVVRGMLRGRRLPEPIYWADRLSREAGRELLG